AREEVYVEGVGLFDSVRTEGVDHRHAELLVVGEHGFGVELRAGVSTRVGRRARPIDQHGIVRVPVARVEGVARVIDLFVRKSARVERGDQAPRPLGVLIEDSDWALYHWTPLTT